MSSDRITLLRDRFIDRLLEDLENPEINTRVYETVRAFLKDWKDEVQDQIPRKTISSVDQIPPAPFKIG